MKLHTRKAFTLIELMIVIAIIAIIAAIAIPNLLSARKNGNESAAIGAIKTIANAQTLYREGDKGNGLGGAPDGTLQYASTILSLSNAGQNLNEDLIDQVLAGGTKSGYNFTVNVGTPAPADQFIWFSNANPVVPGTTGDRYFGGNMAGLIFFSSAAPVVFVAADGTSTASVLGQ